jgi:hypothetical protein
MRLGDLDALLESAGIFEAKVAARGCGKSILHLAKAWLWNEVNKAPTIDAVQVCRCKDCLYWQSGENECEKWEYCTFHNIGIGPHSFCSYGDRKDGEG